VGSDAETEDFELMKSGEEDSWLYRVKSSATVGTKPTACHRPETVIQSRRFFYPKFFARAYQGTRFHDTFDSPQLQR
jgi:hypothetical protein